MEKYKRVFVVVMDSLGVGEMEDSPKFGDTKVHTLLHISESEIGRASCRDRVSAVV